MSAQVENSCGMLHPAPGYQTWEQLALQSIPDSQKVQPTDHSLEILIEQVGKPALSVVCYSLKVELLGQG